MGSVRRLPLAYRSASQCSTRSDLIASWWDLQNGHLLKAHDLAVQREKNFYSASVTVFGFGYWRALR